MPDNPSSVFICFQASTEPSFVTLVASVSPNTGTPTVTDTLAIFIFPENIGAPLAINYLDGPICNLTSTGHSTCAGSTVTYALGDGEFLDPVLDFSVVGASDYTLEGSILTVTWGEAGQGRIIAFSPCGTAFLGVDILPRPIAAFGSSPPAQDSVLTICQGQSVQFQNASVNASSYSWSFGGAGQSSAENPSFAFTEPGSYEVVLVASNDCGCTDETRMTVVVSPAESPIIDCFGTVCEGAQVTYTSTGACGLYEWDVSPEGSIIDGGGSSDDFITINWASGPLGTLSLMVSDCGVTNVCQEPTIMQIPVLSNTAQIQGPTEICTGTASSYSIVPYEGTSYTWSVSPAGQGIITDGQGTPQISVAWSAVFSTAPLQVIVAYDNCYLGCSGADTLAVFMRPEFTISGPIAVCDQGSAAFSAINSQTNAPFSAHWTVRDAAGALVHTVSDSPAPSIDWTFGTGTYTLTAVPSTPSDFCLPAATRPVTVQAPPSAPTGIMGEANICPGQAYTYTAAVPAGGRALRWTITDGGNVSTAFGRSINHTWGSAPPYHLSVVRLSNDGLECESVPFDLAVSALPPLSITGAADACADDIATYSAPVFEGLRYEWEILPAMAGTIVSSPDSAAISVLWHSVGPATLRLNSCGQSIDAAVTVHGVTPLAVHPASLCPNEMAQVQTTATYATHAWIDESGNTVSTLANPMLGPGHYQVSATDAFGCTGSSTFEIVGYPASEISISTPDETRFCNAAPAARLFAVNTDAGYSYQWTQDGNPIPGAIGFSTMPTQTGTYRVNITDVNGCTFSSNPISLLLDCTECATCSGGGSGCSALSDLAFSISPTSQCNVRNYNGSTANAIPGSTGWLFRGPGGDVTAMGNNVTHIYQQAGFYRVFFIGSFDAGGGNTVACGTVQVDTVLVAADFEHSIACAGAPVAFSDLSTFLPIGFITTWAWDFGDPASGADNTSAMAGPDHTFSQPGTYTVSLTVTANTGCTSTMTRSVVVQAPPTISFEEPGISCEGAALPFDVVSASLLTSLAWDFGEPSSGDANTSMRPSSFHAYASTGTYSVTLTAQSIYGCERTFSRSISVTPNALGGDISLSPSSPVCEGTASQLTPPAGGVQWLWSTEELSETISVVETGVYSLTLTDAQGCTFSPASAVLEVIPAPQAPIRAVTYDDAGQPVAYHYDSYEACFGEDVFLQTVIPVGHTVLWSTGQASSEIEFSTLRLNLLPVGEHPITLTVSNAANGCSQVIGPFIVTVRPLPQAPMLNALPAGFVCEGTPVTYSVADVVAGLSYRWNTGQTGTDITTSRAGAYFVEATNEYGCSAESSELAIAAGPDIRRVPSGCHIRCLPDTLCLPTIPGVSGYQWFLGGVAVDGATVPQLVAHQPGDYYLAMTNAQGCTTQSGTLSITRNEDVGSIFGSVYFDVNDNGIIDAGDTLFAGATIVLDNGAGVLTPAVSDTGGQYVFPGIPGAAYTLSVDESALPQYHVSRTPARDTVLRCGQILLLDWLVAKECPSLSGALMLSACAGESVAFGDTLLAAGTVTSLQLLSAGGCDSTLVITVQTLPPTTGTLTLSACEGSSAVYAGQAIAAGTQATFLLTNSAGCDSTLVVSVQTLPPTTGTLTLSACEGASAVYAGQAIAAGTQATFLLTNSAGCDSTLTVVVETLAVQNSTLLFEVCPGETLPYNGQNLQPDTETMFTFPSAGGCDSVVTVMVSAFPSVSFSVEVVPSCPGAADGQISINPEGGQGLTFSIDGQNYQPEPLFLDLSAGGYSLSIEDENGCDTGQSVVVASLPSLAVSVADAALPCDTRTVTLQAFVTAGQDAETTYQWADGTLGNTLTVTVPGVYPVLVSNACETVALSPLVTNEPSGISEAFYIPNAFSPNDDGINDSFRPLAAESVKVLDYEFMVLDRWGALMFSTSDPQAAWNGTHKARPINAGVYVWALKATVEICGDVVTVSEQGDVVLLR